MFTSNPVISNSVIPYFTHALGNDLLAYPVTPKLMVFVKRNIEPSYGERATIMPSTQVDRTGHWSHLSDLPS